MPEEQIGKSHAHFIKLLRLPIVYMLMVSSFPAGFMPFLTAGAYRGIHYAQNINPKWRNPAKIASAQKMFWIALCVSIVAIAIHLAMIQIARRRWNDLLFGLRGAAWFAIFWCAFAAGVVAGVWIYTVAPE
jgi:hypothetical protein